MGARNLHEFAAEIVCEAGGVLIGRTRLQKVAYLAQLAGFHLDFPFEYRHFGPYSESLANAMEIASGLGLVQEEEKRADWGAWYSVYKYTGKSSPDRINHHEIARSSFISAAAKLSAIDLELAATAAFLYDVEGIGREEPSKAWEETARRKPEKAIHGRIERAQEAYRSLLSISTPKRLPAIA